jgi:hypothetical protein
MNFRLRQSWMPLLGLLCALGAIRPVSAQTALLELADVVVFPGQSGVEVEIFLSCDEPVSGLQVGIAVDPDRIILQQLDLSAGVLAAISVEFLDTTTDDEEGEATLLAIIDSEAPFDQSLPAPSAALLGKLVLDASSWLVPANAEPIAFSDGVGEPPIDNLVMVDGVAVVLDLVDGSLSVI